MKILKFKVITPGRIVLESDVAQVTIPTAAGEITILPDHIPLLSIVKPGVILTRQQNKEATYLAISGGFLEFHDNELTILADTAERADEIDLERAEEARKRAEEMKQNQRMHADEEQFANVVSSIEKQLIRIRVAKKYRPKGMGNMNISKK
jgi:F-type H+-transporting ATPase subunit epsilon